MTESTISHPIPPVYDDQSRILILGSFPSAQSREKGFFYAHPQNRFWRVLAAVLREQPVPVTTEQRRAFLIGNRIAAWDVIAECRIVGSSDASIRGARANDISRLLVEAPIQRIFVNGKTAERLYKKLIEPVTGREAYALPSTSPANAAWSLERLVEAWSVIREEIKAAEEYPRQPLIMTVNFVCGLQYESWFSKTTVCSSCCSSSWL